jgi:hypothetical protein
MSYRTHSIDTGNLEAKRASGIIRAVQVVAHHEYDIEQLLELSGIPQVGTGRQQEFQALSVARQHHPASRVTCTDLLEQVQVLRKSNLIQHTLDSIGDMR